MGICCKEITFLVLLIIIVGLMYLNVVRILNNNFGREVVSALHCHVRKVDRTNEYPWFINPCSELPFLCEFLIFNHVIYIGRKFSNFI